MKERRKEPAHAAPKDLRDAIAESGKVKETWSKVTPLAKSEWACWVMSAKKKETRERRIKIAVDKLSKGDRRPCCWPGCPHR